MSKMLEGEMEKLMKMENDLKKRVVGQDEAIIKIANAVRRSRAGVAYEDRYYRFVHISRTNGRGQDRAYQSRGGVYVQ